MNLSAHSLAELVEAGILPEINPTLEHITARYPLAITPAMLSLMDPNDPTDPIAAQFVPSEREAREHPGEMSDPIGDQAHSPVEGIVHRYPDRVLLKLLQACPVYCRFCFRREQVGPQGGVLSHEALEQALAYIAAHPAIWEVILTGGDPLMLSDRRLAEVINRLNALPHVKILRIHTRVPVVDPARITENLIKVLRQRAPVYLLLHCNHPRELTAEAKAACARLVDGGIPLLSQSVLLRGVNDDAEVLAQLMRAFVESRIKPHYLHHLALARGTSHFHVPIAEGQALMRTLRGHLSGLGQPTYMLDLPGGAGKIPLTPCYATSEDGTVWQAEDYRGQPHTYRDSRS